MQILFDVLLFLLPALLAFFVWRDVRTHRQRDRRKGQRLLLVSAAALSCNILLLYFYCLADVVFMRGRPLPLATLGDYEALVGALWASRIAVLVSIVTIVTALLSEHGLSRRLCIWASAVGLIGWPVLNIAASDVVVAYLQYHR